MKGGKVHEEVRAVRTHEKMEGISTMCSDGVLMVTMQKKPPLEPKKIKVKVG